MTNKKKIFISMTVILALVFSCTYYLSDRYFKYKKASNTEANKTVATQNVSSNLDENLKISLFTGDKEDKSLTLKELKSDLNLSNYLTQTELVSALKEQGYELISNADSKLIFRRETDKTVEPNKYYIGEKDGYFAIYKSDEKGNLLIENSKDVYINNKRVDELGAEDKKKIRNFEFKYDTKEDAEEDLSEFLS